MNKRERREQYLFTRRTAEELAKRKEWQEFSKKWKLFCEKYPDLDDKTKEEKYHILVKEGWIDPSITLESIVGGEL